MVSLRDRVPNAYNKFTTLLDELRFHNRNSIRSLNPHVRKSSFHARTFFGSFNINDTTFLSYQAIVVSKLSNYSRRDILRTANLDKPKQLRDKIMSYCELWLANTSKYITRRKNKTSHGESRNDIIDVSGGSEILRRASFWILCSQEQAHDGKLLSEVKTWQYLIWSLMGYLCFYSSKRDN